MSIKIHPTIGVARLGNSPNEFCIVPDKIGGIPLEFEGGKITTKKIQKFKDSKGLIKKQGQPFRVYDQTGEITINRKDIKSIEWTVHLANKKAEWYEFDELKGNLLFGDKNNYASWKVPLRNSDIIKNRQSLFIDYGPRRITVLKGTKPIDSNFKFDKKSVPANYTEAQFPPAKVKYGQPVDSLGGIITDAEGRLIVFGGFGRTGGNTDLTGFGGGDQWHDDISDGPVYCKVTYTDNKVESVDAWCIVGSPDFAPEVVNISTLSDSIFDVYVRNSPGFTPELFDKGKFKPEFEANFQRDIKPVFDRMKGYQWVANVQPMANLASLDFYEINKNNSTANATRQKVFNYFRGIDPYTRTPIENPNPLTYTQKEFDQLDQNKIILKEEKYRAKYPQDKYPQEYLFKDQNKYLTVEGGKEIVKEGDLFPLMPLNSGTNSVRNENPLKFLALTETQLFLLKQWADGKFNLTPDQHWEGVVPASDTISVGNCIGLPMSPGIEVTWNVHNQIIYNLNIPFTLKVKNSLAKYDKVFNVGKETGFLTVTRDECLGGGCEPGDLTKRMACPWQADFFNCTVQNINFTNPTQVKDYIIDNTGKIIDRIPTPPVYYSYWWPPQSPWDVLIGELTKEGFHANGKWESGRQMNYQRGLNSYVQMVEFWDTLGFVKDMNANNAGFPYLLETERGHEFYTSQKPLISEIMVKLKYDNHGLNVDGQAIEIETPIFYLDVAKARRRRKEQFATTENVSLLASGVGRINAITYHPFKKIKISEELSKVRFKFRR
ncbi:L-lysine 6-oxidase [Pedobacter cryoconitis]|uniref:LodA/GoxA family CTQ-dependent oxidase n=1 Tax=Pedobacter cryoconitis TaxID=188932 RepID=UPI00160C7CED|nr:LodA/GoxA family CTQ-dependent oxidase [Pedobacter cryoconitis]MBB6273821.1 L-lysine 6-oxidase [Pedobacter cryoconitis]